MLRTAELISIYKKSDPALEQLTASGVVLVDAYQEQVSELREISPDASAEESYVYYPWIRSLVRTLAKEAFVSVRSNRNRDLIREAEQDAFAQKHIAFAGLNVGNPGAVCIALEGGSRTMSFSDPDHLSLANLNRFRASISDVGVNKAILTARQVLEIDPYYDINVDTKGLSESNISSFLEGADLLIEEMDQLPLKLKVRDEARRRGIPVVMVTGNGPGVIIDIERYDHDQDLPILNGRIPPQIENDVRREDFHTLPKADKARMAKDFMDPDCLHPRLVASFAKLGTELVGIPQLAESSFLRGAAICHAARLIITGSVDSGRYTMDLEDIMRSSTL